MKYRHVTLLLGILAAPGILHAQGSISLPVPLAELIKRATVDSNDPAAHYNVALGYWKDKKWSDVDRALSTAMLLDPRFAEAHLAMAFLQIASSQKLLESTDEAQKDARQKVIEKFNREYRHAFLINPKVDLRIMASVSRSNDDAALRAVYGPLFAEYIGGMANCQEGKYEQCEDRLTRVIAGRAGYGAPDDAHWYRGLAAAHQAHYEVGAGDFRVLLERVLKRVQAAEEKGMVRAPIRANEYRYFEAVFRHMNGDHIPAVDLYREVLENDLGMYIAHVRLAEIYETRRDYVHAVEERQRAIDANPDDRSLQFDLGVTLGKAGKMAEAETVLRGATEAMPRSIEAWFWLGLACEQTGKKADAVAAYQRVVALAPSRFKARADQASARIAALK